MIGAVERLDGRRPGRDDVAVAIVATGPTTVEALSSSSRSSDVGCDFSLEHYREILRAAAVGGDRKNAER